ncbi:cell filamentation protein Fic [Aeromonas veronii]|nr:cell filamentation protein Fic [Aeromonas veronii]KRW01896.1 cell filamentation protein Fic [Aeromonas veronii]KRW10895.1 cell filamentation protein Fic [Aeromonas veronii]KRW13025.1 cell filamentation protein Fic [Aeromonas veronii]KRW15816.1 cell filamentation protein Fic [Aeromonas veronii]
MEPFWIWQQADWPHFRWRDSEILPRLRQVQRRQGILIGSHSRLGNPDQTLDTLLANIIASSAIEGERLNAQSVRSSLDRRLGGSQTQSYPVSERSEGLAAMMLDAIDNHGQPLTIERLYQWHRWLFPVNEWSVKRLHVGQLRGDAPMLVVSGRVDRPTVHFEAPPRATLDDQLAEFIPWFNQTRHDPTMDPLLRAAICHLWFVTLHPVDDGNGRLTRALTDLALSQADSHSIRLYAMSVAILELRGDYYRALESAQRGSLDITSWICWFLDTLDYAIELALQVIERSLAKKHFWLQHCHDGLSPEQTKVINRLLDGGQQGFENGINASQYQKVAGVSKATATRHLAELVGRGCIEKLPGGGRNTRYQIRLHTEGV